MQPRRVKLGTDETRHSWQSRKGAEDSKTPFATHGNRFVEFMPNPPVGREA